VKTETDFINATIRVNTGAWFETYGKIWPKDRNQGLITPPRHQAPGPDPYSTLVYAARGSDVRTTIVDGQILVDEFAPVRVDRAEVVVTARAAARELASRTGI
jgi:cytosine/adenosine deaminase-related metal-dependent hydrolase